MASSRGTVRACRNESTMALTNSPFWPYLTTLLREMPLKVVGALGLTVCLTLTEGMGLLMLVPLLHSVGLDVQQGTPGHIAAFLSSLFLAVGLRPTLTVVLCTYVLITSLHALLRRWQSTANFALQHHLVALLRQRLYRAIAHADWLFFAKSRSSDFSHILTHEVERVGSATYQLLHLVATIVVSLAYVLFALKISAVTTGLVILCGGFLLLLLKGKTHIARRAGEKASEAMNRLFAAVTEHVGAIKTVKSYGVEHRHVLLFAKLTERVHQAYIQAIRNAAQVKSWFDIGSVLVLSFIVYVALQVLTISTAEVLLLVFLFARIMPRFSSTLQGYQSFVNLMPAFSSLMEMEAGCTAAAEPRAQTVEHFPLREEICLDCVSFGYEEKRVIHDLNLTINAGEITALVGPSGAGKSTVADLIMGLIVPQQGCVLVDGSPLVPDRVQSWRKQIGYVAQDTVLFHETVRENLLWAKPNAIEEEIWEALRLAAADAYVTGLPQGLDTVVGDRGVLLSGGERQRLALARALLRKPTLLILDEATSNLDPENERRILQAIEQLRGSVTIVIISHRLAAVRGADVIHLLEKGRLVESETFSALIVKENGKFRALYQAG